MMEGVDEDVISFEAVLKVGPDVRFGVDYKVDCSDPKSGCRYRVTLVVWCRYYGGLQ